MNEHVQVSIQARTDFFEKYYEVPSDVEPDVEQFVREMKGLGESCLDATEFESKFTSMGLAERFNQLLIRCVPKPYQMLEAEKKQVKEMTKKMMKENQGQLVKDAVEDAVDYASVMAEEELISMKRKAMIEMGVFDDYTRATNTIEYTKDAVSFLSGLFKKKKK